MPPSAKTLREVCNPPRSKEESTRVPRLVPTADQAPVNAVGRMRNETPSPGIPNRGEVGRKWNKPMKSRPQSFYNRPVNEDTFSAAPVERIPTPSCSQLSPLLTLPLFGPLSLLKGLFFAFFLEVLLAEKPAASKPEVLLAEKPAASRPVSVLSQTPLKKRG